MTISVLCQLWEFIKFHVVTIPNVADEGLCIIAGCASCYYLWLCTDELFRFQFKHLQFNVELNPPSCHLCHVVILFFMKPDKNKDTNGRTCDVHKLNNNELGGCMIFFWTNG